MAEKKKLTAKQQRFVEAYDGNATKAAIAAGYSEKIARQMGQHNMTNHVIAAAIAAREEKRNTPLIMTRQQRQELWTKIALDANEQTRDRLKASELLGKSEADFIDRAEISGPDQGPVLVMGAEMSAAVLKRTREILEGMK